jgi:hypothetical protein
MPVRDSEGWGSSALFIKIKIVTLGGELEPPLHND